MSGPKANPRKPSGRFASPLVITGQGDNRRTMGEHDTDGDKLKGASLPLWLAILVLYGALVVIGSTYEVITRR